MFRWFEQRLDPFPAQEPVEPPRTLVAFCFYYTRGAWPYIAATGLLITAIALAEVWMFGFLGRIVDWLSAQNRETFLQTEGWKLAAMAFVVVDTSGHVVSAQRMMQARWMGIDIAQGKAYTAAAFVEPTHVRAEKAKALLQFTTSLAAMSQGRYMAQDGGFPLIRDGMLYGGIGASGGVGEEDDAALLPALKAVGFDLPH